MKDWKDTGKEQNSSGDQCSKECTWNQVGFLVIIYQELHESTC